ncbi:cilia- and flagella-associated protein 97 isoform X1 [Pygocentrus nattereri]|uniref:cilia- and flagella-associated protein 97 isoform X1 n=1 Tax=Pygocentrus nattereri TaxID=42514 RepID=UPI00189148FF|nr:cilia- and flagella-associated protein 97 isoform X1 [Pygocentrus nattereri]XP_037388515.1 cilia- and flagella-associated protein 97 isoform X1 [Pygocentrus nattereri]
MFSPKELEGEVDHSFFDSDGEPGKTIHQDPEERQGDQVKNPSQTETSQMGRQTKDGGRVQVEEKETEKDAVLKAESLEEVFSSLQIQTESVGHSDRTKERKEDDSESSAVKERREAESGRDDSDASSRRSSPPPRSESGQSDDSSSARSYTSVEPQSDSSAEEGEDDDGGVLKDDDDDGYSDTESDNNRREEPPEPPPSKHPSEAYRKSLGKFRSRSRSSSSDRESSLGGDGGSPAHLHKLSATQATSSPRRRPRSGPAKQRERTKGSETAESEDTVTDVTPLSTPDVSPGQSFDLTPPTEPLVTVTAPQRQDVTEEPSVTEVDAVRRKSSDTDGDERSAVLSAGRRVDSVLVISSPSSASSTSCGGRRRKNFSFTDEEVRRIERENQRLLRELSRSSPRSRSGGSARRSAPPTARLYHSALNRQREQQRIQRENLAFLKRLESVKPTPGMTRAEQLSDYQRQAGYLGIPNPLTRPTSGTNTPAPLNPHLILSRAVSSCRCTAIRRQGIQTLQYNQSSQNQARYSET